MFYEDEARAIWKEFAPPSGQADTVQGELMRAVEKLRVQRFCVWKERCRLEASGPKLGIEQHSIPASANPQASAACP